MPKITKLKAIVFVFWVTFFIGIFLTSRSRQPVQLEFELKVRASEKTENIGKFYFDTGYGFNEEETVTVSYEPVEDGEMKQYQLVVPEKIQNIEKVRFSPLDSAGEVVVKNIRLSKMEISSLLTYSNTPQEQKMLKQIQKISIMGNQYYVITTGDTPHFELEGTFSYPFFKELIKEIKQQDILQILMVLVLLLTLSVVLTVYSTNLKKGERPRIP